MAQNYGPNIITDGLVLNLDAADINSYPGPTSVDVMVVGGGGGGGMDMGGGGGGGGVVYQQNVAVTPGTPISVTVGAGGWGAPAGSGGYRGDGAGPQPGGHQFTIGATAGGNSVFGSITALGGGFGASSYFGYTPNYGYGGSGASGGGASGYSDGSTGRAGAGTAGQGFNGGGSGGQYYSGGGGGAGGPGIGGTSRPDGGPGIIIPEMSPFYFGGGGGGASYSLSTGGYGGIGGGGGGALGTTFGGAGLNNGSPGGGGSPGVWAQTPGGNAGANTGGGGGGGSHYNATNQGGNGGSGIVIVRYQGPQGATGGNVTSRNGYTYHTFLSSGTFTPGGIGRWYDTSGNNYTHTLNNNATRTIFQGVQCFDCSTNGWIIPLSSTYTFTQNYTMIAWANALSEGQVGTWRTLWRTTPDDHPILIQDGSDLIGYYDNNGPGFVSYGATLGGLGLANKWTMFTLTGTGGSTYLYYNNATYVGGVGYGASGNNHDAIGNVNGTSQPFGYVASAMLYNRPLTTAEIQQIYNQTKTRFGL